MIARCTRNNVPPTRLCYEVIVLAVLVILVLSII